MLAHGAIGRVGVSRLDGGKDDVVVILVALQAALEGHLEAAVGNQPGGEFGCNPDQGGILASRQDQRVKCPPGCGVVVDFALQ